MWEAGYQITDLLGLALPRWFFLFFGALVPHYHFQFLFCFLIAFHLKIQFFPDFFFLCFSHWLQFWFLFFSYFRRILLYLDLSRFFVSISPASVQVLLLFDFLRGLSRSVFTHLRRTLLVPACGLSCTVSRLFPWLRFPAIVSRFKMVTRLPFFFLWVKLAQWKAHAA